ncbi:MAG: hypothetical protein U9O18_06675 [Chloroflexota bacterium]|nr:hypothetical protein [Chloroflexota bacterium]
MRRWTTGVAMVCAAVLASAAVATAGDVRTVVTFDGEVGEFPEGVAVTRQGVVYTGLSHQGRLMQIESPGEANDLATVPLEEGDFGLAGLAASDHRGIYSTVISANPELNGVLGFDHVNGDWFHLEGTEAMAMPNAIAFGNDDIDDEVMYVTDSASGAVWRTEWVGFRGWLPAELWVTDPLLEGTGELPFPFPIGANGVAVDDRVVYVGVTERSHIVGIPVEADGTAGEPFVHLELPGIAIDGIAITDDGDFLVADPPANTVWFIGDDSVPIVVADAADGISGPTSVFVDAGLDRQPVYVANMAQAVVGELAPHGPSIMSIALD